MLKAIATMLIGAVPAAAATYYFVFASPSTEAAASGAVIERAGSRTPASGSAGPSGAGSLAVFRRAAAIGEPAALESRLAEVMAEPASVAREAEVAALFGRLAALDLGRALRVSETVGFDPALVAGVLRALAEDDPDTALAALASVRSPTSRLEIAVALLDVIGRRPQDIERIAAVLPDYQRIDFQAEALASLAATDANGALRIALGLGDAGASNAAAQRIGMAWVHLDPLVAISRGDTLPPELRAGYRTSVSREWAKLDVGAFLDYADTQPQLDDLLPAMMHAMSVDPERTFEIASRHPPVPIGRGYGSNVTIERMAFAGMVEQDPERMLGVLAAMPENPRKQEFLRAFAETYGRRQPREALAWARSLEPPVPGLDATVIAYASATDLDQALDWFIEYEVTPPSNPVTSPQFIAFTIGTVVGTGNRRVDVANRLLTLKDNPNAARTLTRLTSVWAVADPASAFEWLVSSGSAPDPALVANIGGAVAGYNAKTAAAFTDRLPPEVRGVWLQQVAAQYASQDPDGAATWILRFQGEPYYDAVLRQVVQRSATVDPESTARMLQAAPDDLQQSTAPRVASAWAAQDLRRAGQWAAGLGNASARNAAVSQVASTWAYRDPQAAQRWAGSLPQGETRDQALSSILARLARNDFVSTIDWRLLDDFDSDAARDRTVVSLVGTLAASNPERARSVVADWISDPGLRRQAEASIASAAERAR